MIMGSDALIISREFFLMIKIDKNRDDRKKIAKWKKEKQ